MPGCSDITDHYENGDLLSRLQAALAEDGLDPARPSIEGLAPYDHFHGRGLEATHELADALSVSATAHLLDIGSGIGGPARYLANRFGCHVTGVDLTPEFCEVARHLTKMIGLEALVRFEQGDALAMPFADASFDAAYSMNVSMNIADKTKFYGEIHRVLRPGAPLVLSELALGSGDGPDYPTPWAKTAQTSFLVSLQDTLAGLESSGFSIVNARNTSAQTMAFSARSRVLVERGEKPPHRAVQLIHGEQAAAAMANTIRGVKESRLVPIEVVCKKSGDPGA
jgi:SAM-dependent methyltransferase